jgi:hypothetical protein
MRLDLNQIRDTDFAADFRRKTSKKHSCLKFFSCLFLVFIVILIGLYLTIRWFVGPIIQKADRLPNDFPSEFALYQLNQAEIKLQTAESKKKLLDLIGILPNWLLDPIADNLSEKVKIDLTQTFGDKIDLNQSLDSEELKQALSSVDLSKIQTISLSWDSLDQSKEEITAWYKQKLAENNFEFKENLADYQINLGFWKGNTFGTMSFEDLPGNDNFSAAKMIINYLQQ